MYCTNSVSFLIVCQLCHFQPCQYVHWPATAATDSSTAGSVSSTTAAVPGRGCLNLGPAFPSTTPTGVQFLTSNRIVSRVPMAITRVACSTGRQLNISGTTFAARGRAVLFASLTSRSSYKSPDATALHDSYRDSLRCVWR